LDSLEGEIRPRCAGCERLRAAMKRHWAMVSSRHSDGCSARENGHPIPDSEFTNQSIRPLMPLAIELPLREQTGQSR